MQGNKGERHERRQTLEFLGLMLWLAVGNGHSERAVPALGCVTFNPLSMAEQSSSAKRMEGSNTLACTTADSGGFCHKGLGDESSTSDDENRSLPTENSALRSLEGFR